MKYIILLALMITACINQIIYPSFVDNADGICEGAGGLGYIIINGASTGAYRYATIVCKNDLRVVVDLKGDWNKPEMPTK